MFTCLLIKKGKSESYWEYIFCYRVQEAYSELSQTTMVENFVEIINSFQVLTSFAENSI